MGATEVAELREHHRGRVLVHEQVRDHRLGEDWVERIREAMIPHLFVDDDPPAVMLAELGDLGGAHGGALLASRRAAGG